MTFAISKYSTCWQGIDATEIVGRFHKIPSNTFRILSIYVRHTWASYLYVVVRTKVYLVIVVVVVATAATSVMMMTMMMMAVSSARSHLMIFSRLWAGCGCCGHCCCRRQRCQMFLRFVFAVVGVVDAIVAVAACALTARTLTLASQLALAAFVFRLVLLYSTQCRCCNCCCCFWCLSFHGWSCSRSWCMCGRRAALSVSSGWWRWCWCLWWCLWEWFNYSETANSHYSTKALGTTTIKEADFVGLLGAGQERCFNLFWFHFIWIWFVLWITRHT